MHKMHSAYRPNNLLLIQELEALSYRPCPRWLGDFSFKMFGRTYGRDYGIPTGLIAEEIEALKALAPSQEWTTYFIQRYEPGENVFSHRDPKNNIGYTIIGTYGDYDPAPITNINGHTFRQNPGDVLVLPCTISGQQGPRHSVRWDQAATGIRYAIILNTIR